MKKYNIGLTVGVFDLFHPGHLNLLEKCKERCDYLIVGLCGDDYVRTVKHKEPIFDEIQRARILSALKCIDKVVRMSIEEIEDKVLFWKKEKFDVLFSGSDWQGTERFIKTEEEFKQHNIAIEFFPYTHGICTTDIAKTILAEVAKHELDQ